MTHPYCETYVFLRVTQPIHTRAVTHSYACRDEFIHMTHPYRATYVLVRVTRPIHTRAVAHSYACRDQFIRAPWLIHIYDSAISCSIFRMSWYVWCVPFIRVPCLIHKRAVIHADMVTHPYRATYVLVCVTRLINTRAATRSHIWLIHIVQHTSLSFAHVWFIHIMHVWFIHIMHTSRIHVMYIMTHLLCAHVIYMWIYTTHPRISSNIRHMYMWHISCLIRCVYMSIYMWIYTTHPHIYDSSTSYNIRHLHTSRIHVTYNTPHSLCEHVMYMSICTTHPHTSCNIRHLHTWFIHLTYNTPHLLCVHVDLHVDIHDSSTHMAYLVTCNTRHAYIWRDVFIRVPWRVHTYDSSISCNICLGTCDATHSYACHDSFIRVPWLINIYRSSILRNTCRHACDATHSYACRDWFIHVTWLVYVYVFQLKAHKISVGDKVGWRKGGLRRRGEVVDWRQAKRG